MKFAGSRLQTAWCRGQGYSGDWAGASHPPLKPGSVHRYPSFPRQPVSAGGANPARGREPVSPVPSAASRGCRTRSGGPRGFVPRPGGWQCPAALPTAAGRRCPRPARLAGAPARRGEGSGGSPRRWARLGRGEIKPSGRRGRARGSFAFPALPASAAPSCGSGPPASPPPASAVPAPRQSRRARSCLRPAHPRRGLCQRSAGMSAGSDS